jgi:hypothetical protein
VLSREALLLSFGTRLHKETEPVQQKMGPLGKDGGDSYVKDHERGGAPIRRAL